ncbi:MAG TPA: ribosomal protein S18-alanine N-acetyltransferase [Burkholderiaceae bacterium]|jgi:ribosomal-protein-alanine N-acetyltransferase|nr:ribosomal protein S18-alanine N-acetyltransferase [Burkholderiaceae bacterium]
MSAVRKPSEAGSAEPSLRAVTVDLLPEVLAIEVEAYAFPWTRGNFIDAVAAGYVMRALVAPEGTLLGYFVAMPGVDEIHLLNITVARGHQGGGHARRLLVNVYAQGRAHGASAVWLEVRESNARARALYLREGFVEAGRRRDYYPAPLGRHEDAILMTRALDGSRA